MCRIGQVHQCRRLVRDCAVLLLFLTATSFGQQSCPAPNAVVTPAPGNIFSDQQEMDLGDAFAEQFERDFHVIQDDSLNAYLQNLGEKLVRQMPPTSLRFRFRLVELPIVNAFTLPGGRIYVTRRLVLFARSEDELAGVLAHELGHAITHQPAADASALFRQVMGVTTVGGSRRRIRPIQPAP